MTVYILDKHMQLLSTVNSAVLVPRVRDTITFFDQRKEGIHGYKGKKIRAIVTGVNIDMTSDAVRVRTDVE